jgi:phage terminase Nu1 subunit (DNA packaging protein)
MGWGRTLLLGDIGNRLDIEDTEQDISEIRRELAATHRLDESQEDAIKRLKAENEQLVICVAALVNALQRKGVFSADEVSNLIRMIDQ